MQVGDIVKFKGRNNDDQAFYYVKDDFEDGSYYVKRFEHPDHELYHRGWIVKPKEVRTPFDEEMVDYLAAVLKDEMVRAYAETI